MTRNATDPQKARAALKNAAEQLLDGVAPGPLTGVRLAELAGVKRHRLTHDNPDINIRFQERAREINRSKPEVELLRKRLAQERERNIKLDSDVDSLTLQLRNYATALAFVIDERERLIDQLRTNDEIQSFRRPVVPPR